MEFYFVTSPRQYKQCEEVVFSTLEFHQIRVKSYTLVPIYYVEFKQ